jgi:F0F1-type ATP synthase gamma subunit
VKELEQSIESGRKFSQEISQEPDDQKVLDKINEEINKSSIFGLDIEKLLTELWDKFETFDGITKLVFVML